MKLLLDTNLVIAAEDISATSVHQFADRAITLIELAVAEGHDVFVSAASADDLARALSPELRRARSLQLRRYERLDRIVPSPELRARAGYSSDVLDASDTADLELLAALDMGAVDLLITEDAALRRHAAQAGYREEALSALDALELLTGLAAREVARPTLSERRAYGLDPTDPIFGSIRADYGDHEPPFDEWWSKCCQEHRLCLVIERPSGLDAVAVVKEERTDLWGLAEPVMKLCLFKVSEEATGAKRGELLLDGVLRRSAPRFASLFVEVFPKHEAVIALCRSFGFVEVDRTAEGELVLAKSLRPSGDDRSSMDPWSYHFTFGPPAMKVNRAFVIPVEPVWHDILFPELAPVQELFGPRPSGNAVAKAYLSNSRITSLARGDAVLFYRSHREQGVTVAGVVEQAVRPESLDQALALVGSRTVYTAEEVRQRWDRGHLLVVLFRRDHAIDPMWSRATLIDRGVLNAAPQSITQVRSKEGLRWIQSQMSG